MHQMMLQRFQDEALERLSPNTLSVGAAPLVSGGGAGEIIGADGSVGTQLKRRRYGAEAGAGAAARQQPPRQN
jgi:hypothetical protein